MASKTIVSYVDDLDGVSEAARTVNFSLDGVSYEIDLSEEHFDEMFGALNPYVQAARKTGGRRGAASSAKPRGGRGSTNTQEIRDWAKSQGLEVSDRGRVSASIREQYEKQLVNA